MGVLTRDEIIQEVHAGRIGIDPFQEALVGPASVDLHLGDKFYVFRKVHQVFHVTEEADYHQITDQVVVRPGDEILIMPQETILGITRERITLPEDLCGWLQGRSRFARLGLLVHIAAPFMHPGISNHQCLEMSNCGPVPLAVKPDLPICQFVFQRTVGRARYDGRFRDQTQASY
ncbi:MAG: dCTP deaminase [Planctomycetes bacterium]|nr:dCTP deaminase [Planctomycetota bacterium]